jgi:hypothetical protein
LFLLDINNSPYQKKINKKKLQNGNSLPQENDQAPPPYTPFPEKTTPKSEQEIELEKAIEIADKALVHLRSGKKYLNQAANWGVADILGGDFISTFVKQDNMSDVKKELKLARSELMKLKDELQNIENMNILQGTQLLQLGDLLFDGLFFDVLVQSKINEAKVDCKMTIVKVENIKKELEAKLNKLTSNKI